MDTLLGWYESARDTVASIDLSKPLIGLAAALAVHELANSSVNFVVRPWCRGSDYWALRWDLTRALKEGLETAGCSIPYPQQDVHHKQAAVAS